MKPNGTFSYIHFLQPHKPYTPPQSYLRRFSAELTDWNTLHTAWLAANQSGQAQKSTIRGLKCRYRANIQYVDAAVGELFDKLKKAGLYDESVIVVMADHGDAFFKHKQFGHNSTLYDDMTRIPMIMKFPKSQGVKPRRVKQPVETIDVLPTLCDFLKLSQPMGLEGDSLWSLCTGDKNELPGAEVITCTIQRSRHAVRFRDFKYIYNKRGGLEELYDLRSDPDEQHNLASRDPKKTKDMHELLARSVDLIGGKTVAQSSKLSDDPKMKSLIESLGYSSKGIDEEYGFDPASATSQPTTQPSFTNEDESDGDC
ncbi:MAG: sulfatase-like hydrolase/transferase [Planctomycetes bacterium]|nr:sulfatase-like hydrolase/transferase [Planctomycetota bacterium]